MKRCPACAEKIQSAAKICRYCNYQFSEQELKLQQGRGIAIGLAIIVGGGVMLGLCTASGPQKPYTPIASSEQCNLSAAQALLATLRDNGLVLSDTTNGVAVDERAWRQLSMGERLTVAKAVACKMTGGMAETGTYVSIRASDRATIIASGLPYLGTFSDKD